ncbi:phosphoethanolamine--lipid A transferase [Sulfurovum sp. XGS-02]|uniref:phosphoethanolamine transferase n=1 Tax=Sulfurovum sp. XGS-02 TaxID=2925411 RepID=UPI00204C0444|nr:phosphoethanolamine--lipid A transferase [Sulfurovum sp. XGS-02]UPT77162.1 phosphoethanolamine--lipid A transferase [Sulfurovum sp. XGS-02]
MKSRTSATLIIGVSLFIVLFTNVSFFKHVLEVYPFDSTYAPFVISQGVVLFLFLTLLFSLLSWRYVTKPMLIVMLMTAATVNYFMQTYNIIIDTTMIENTVQTDINEASDLMSWKLFGYVLLFGVLPSYIIYKTPVVYRGFRNELSSKLKLSVGSFVLIFVVMLPFSKHYTSFFREHKILRSYTNPTYGLYALGSYVKAQVTETNMPLIETGLDAKIEKREKRKVVMMVVGEAARADHFSLNGYHRETNPQVKKENIINFSNMYSCGTTTAVSVPCMFSIYDRSDYDTQKGLHRENVLDVLSHAGVEVLWRDNNSDSKGVADRVQYEHYKTPENNTMCEGECRDEGMLVGLDRLIEESDKDMIIVLHQMGNHGPAYYKRYPKAFERFTPTCQTNQLEECTQEEIANAYDNALLYTDHFLSQTIGILKKYEDTVDTAMFYMADHGESLGEGGLYLHGLPYFIAPDTQKHVASVLWLGKNFPLDKEEIGKVASHEFSQDNLFSTLLGLFDVESEVYDQKMDILKFTNL